jgi:hypothetical protein
MIVISAVLFLMAGALLHSFSLMCRKLPPERRPAAYPRRGFEQILLNIAWILLAATGLRQAFLLSFTADFVAIGIYFLVLPFVFQPALARAMGFRSLREYVEATNRK